MTTHRVPPPGCCQSDDTANTRKVCRCAGCGEWLDEHEVADGSHMRTAYDSRGYAYPELCGPVNEVGEMKEGRQLRW